MKRLVNFIKEIKVTTATTHEHRPFLADVTRSNLPSCKAPRLTCRADARSCRARTYNTICSAQRRDSSSNCKTWPPGGVFHTSAVAVLTQWLLHTMDSANGELRSWAMTEITRANWVTNPILSSRELCSSCNANHNSKLINFGSWKS